MGLFEPNYNLPMNNNKLFERLSILYKKEIEQRYMELRKTVLSEKNIVNEIDKFYLQIDPNLLIKDQEKWGIIPGYDTNQMKDYIHNRLIYMDKVMNYKNNKISS